jgi:hypothetical protein
MKCPDGLCDQTKVYDLKRQDAFFETAKEKWKGNFIPEFTWWQDSFKAAMREIGDSCPAN